MEIHHFLAATPEQKAVFYKPFHTLIAFWLVGLWISIQKIPERFLPEAQFVHKYISSDILKGAVVVVALVCLNLLLRDTMVLAEADRQRYLGHHSIAAPTPTPAPTAVQNAQDLAAQETRALLDKQINESKKQLLEAEAQLQALRKEQLQALQHPPTPPPAPATVPPHAPPKEQAKPPAPHKVHHPKKRTQHLDDVAALSAMYDEKIQRLLADAKQDELKALEKKREERE